VTIRYDRRGDLYSIASQDVTVSTQPCRISGYRVCLLLPGFPLAIPTTSPKEGDTWQLGEIYFRVAQQMDQLQILDVQLNDVLILNVTDRAGFVEDGRRVQGSDVSYSFVIARREGVVAYTARGSEYAAVWFAEKLPSVAGEPIGQATEDE
jgi:hypothetical protein